MEVSFNPQISFRSNGSQQQVKDKSADSTETIVNTAVSAENKPDTVTISAADKKQEKKHPFKNFIANTAKFFVTTSEMVQGTVKGAAYGVVTGGAILGTGWLFGALPGGFRKGGSLREVCKFPLKSISTKTKVIAGIATAGVFAFNIISAKLKANQRTANVDHQLKTGHRAA